MKKKLAILAAIGVLAAPQVVGAEGFGLNEWSAEGVAMGGARMFAEEDAANVAYNPASITKVSGEAVKMSISYISPHGKYNLYKNDGTEVPDGVNHNRVHPGLVPGTYYVKQMNEKDWFAIGAFSRFAMVSEFERGSVAGSNAFLSKMNGISVTPTFAHKFDNKWSAAVGAEINYVGLTLEKNLYHPLAGREIGFTHLEGDTYAMGWNAAANYTFDDKNEVGVSYRSRITHSLEADFKGYTAMGDVIADAYGVVTLPDSWALGYNHKFDKKTRVELNATRTNWSTYDALNIYFSNVNAPAMLAPSFQQPNLNPKNWESGWRYAIGVEHKLSDKYAVMAGFAYDGSLIPYDGGDFIVPTGNRRTYTIGMQYQDKKEALGVTLGWMQLGDLQFASHDSRYDRVHTHDNFAKMASISYQRKF